MLWRGSKAAFSRPIDRGGKVHHSRMINRPSPVFTACFLGSRLLVSRASPSGAPLKAAFNRTLIILPTIRSVSLASGLHAAHRAI